MIIGRSLFNIYLIGALMTFGAGCQSPEKKQAKKKEKQVSTLAIHLETARDALDFSRSIEIFRENPLVVNVERSPFLTEAEVAEARIVPEREGWSLLIKFNQRGTWLLEQYTTTNPGKHLAIFSVFGEDKKEARWLAAPKITKRISNGILTFTPDATREEAGEMAFGLNNLVKQVAKKDKW